MKWIYTPLAILLAATTLTGCGSPCAGLTATERDKQAAADGYEVERQGTRGAECELNRDGTWSVED